MASKKTKSTKEVIQKKKVKVSSKISKTKKEVNKGDKKVIKKTIKNPTLKAEKSKAEIIKEFTVSDLDRKYQKFGLYFHLIFFAIINSIMFLVNIFTQTPIWFVWPLIGWGLVFGIHAIMVFFMPTKLEKFEQKYLEKIIKESFEN